MTSVYSIATITNIEHHNLTAWPNQPYRAIYYLPDAAQWYYTLFVSYFSRYSELLIFSLYNNSFSSIIHSLSRMHCVIFDNWLMQPVTCNTKMTKLVSNRVVVPV